MRFFKVKSQTSVAGGGHYNHTPRAWTNREENGSMSILSALCNTLLHLAAHALSLLL